MFAVILRAHGRYVATHPPQRHALPAGPASSSLQGLPLRGKKFQVGARSHPSISPVRTQFLFEACIPVSAFPATPRQSIRHACVGNNLSFFFRQCDFLACSNFWECLTLRSCWTLAVSNSSATRFPAASSPSVSPCTSSTAPHLSSDSICHRASLTRRQKIFEATELGRLLPASAESP